MLGVGVCAMDVGAMTVFLYTFTEREKIYNFCEQLTGARFHDVLTLESAAKSAIFLRA
jgi:NADH:ubiquinone oxidoreductase subunit D